MVFENVVTDLLNRYLGSYVENLDKSQLKIGIWGGDVVLTNLQIKQSALDDLDLPVKTIYGYLGRMVLKIPWKNLYKEPVEATVDDLYILVAPLQSIEYNYEKEEKKKIDSKNAELARIDAAKKLEKEKNKPKPDKSFSEKLTAQIINNVQIRVSNIHIRYEDANPTGLPFALGLSLSNFFVHTTDEHWNRSFISEMMKKVYKMAELEGLAVYMNCNSELFTSHDVVNYPIMFQQTIATKSTQPDNFNYVLGPISSASKLILNTYPEHDEEPFTIPKVQLEVGMHKLAVGITRIQFKQLIQLTESMGRMIRGLPYREFRPVGKSYRGHYKLWWHFAYTCVSRDIKRHQLEWSWRHISWHRSTCKEYGTAYYNKLITKKPTIDVINLCKDLEHKLDLFNIILIREQIELEVDRKEKIIQEVPKPASWFSSWWSGNKNDDSDIGDSGNIMTQFEAAMTPEEKSKLYSAIGYQENSIPTELPDFYIATKLNFNLKLLQIAVHNEEISSSDMDLSFIASLDSSIEQDPNRVILLHLNNVICDVEQRPAATALKVKVGLKDLSIFGIQQSGVIPVLAKCKFEESEDNLLNLFFETNPLDKLCDQRIDVKTRSLQIIYDAETVIQMSEVFKKPSDAHLADLHEAATNELSNIKERSATGLQYMIEKHTQLEVDIVLMPSYILMPEFGLYIPYESRLLILNLGKLTLKTEPRKLNANDVTSMYLMGAKNEDILKEMMEQSYDKFILKINNMQMLLALADEHWSEELVASKLTRMHILEPTSLFVSAHVCVIDDDPRLPKLKITGQLPKLQISTSQSRILDAIKLITGVPFPQGDVPEEEPLKKDSLLTSSTMSIKKFLENERLKKSQKDIDPTLEIEILQYTNLEVSFVLKEFGFTLFENSDDSVISGTSSTEEFHTPEEHLHIPAIRFTLQNEKEELRPKLLQFKIKEFEVDMVQRTYDMKVVLRLGAIQFDQYKLTAIKTKIINIIKTPKYDHTKDYLFTVNYVNANKLSPEFATRYLSTEQLIEIKFSTIMFLLNLEGLSELLRISADFQTKLAEITEINNATNENNLDRVGTTHDTAPIVLIAKDKLSVISEEPSNITAGTTVTFKENSKPKQKQLKKVTTVVDSIKIKVLATLEEVSLALENEKRKITIMKVDNFTASVILKSSYTEIIVKLRDILVLDENPLSLHPIILSIVGGNAIVCQVIVYNLDETSGYNNDDMKIDVSMGCVKIVFLNWFVNSVLNFLDHFQEAQAAIAQAGAVAADAAKQNVVDAYTNATRMKLNIRIKAPVIIVPVDSQSMQAICIDLGYLCITNTCTDIPTDHERGLAVIDEMKIELKDMKLSKVEISKTELDRLTHTLSDIVFGIKSDVHILDPTSFALIIQRNLSMSWYKTRPELEVSGRIKTIELNLIATDYQVIMQILARNMTEGSNERTVKPVPVTTSAPHLEAPTPTVETIKTNIIDDNKTDNDIVLDDDDEDGTSSSAWTTLSRKTIGARPFSIDLTELHKLKESSKKKIDIVLKFAFQIDSIIANLFDSPNVGLATFGLYFLSLKGHKLADGSMTTAAILCDINVDDARPHRNNIFSRLMKRREILTPVQQYSDLTLPDHESQTIKSMIDVICNMTENDLFVELRVSSFDLIISLDFILKIQLFLQTAQEEVHLDNIKIKKDIKTLGKVSSTTVGQTASMHTPAAKPNNKKMTIILQVEQPEIILVEKIDDINCHALIFNSEVSMKLRTYGERMYIKGEINELCFYMAEFNPSKRHLTKHYILHPCGISLNGSTPAGKGLHLSLNVSNIKICVSPGIIELLNKAMNTMIDPEKVIKPESKPPPDLSNLWAVTYFEADDYWFIRADEGEDALLSFSSAIEYHKQELCIVEVPSIVLVIETGIGFFATPMLIIETGMDAKIKNWSFQMEIESSLRLQTNYYNNAMAMWEPLIEPNETDKEIGVSEYDAWELSFNMSVDASNENIEKTTTITITSMEVLEMTVTKTCLEVMRHLGQSFSEAISATGLAKPEVEAPYAIQNDTGFDITINLAIGAFNLHTSHLPNIGTSDLLDETSKSLIFENGDSSTSKYISPDEIKMVKVSPGARVFLQLKNENESDFSIGSSSGHNLLAKEKFLHIEFGDINKELILPVHKADQRYFPLYRDTKKEPWGIISDIIFEYGCSIVTIRGILQIHNHFTVPIDVYRIKSGSEHLIDTIGPNKILNMPLHAIYAISKELYFSIPGYKTSIQSISWKEFPSEFNLVRSLQCDPIDTYEPFYIAAVRERKEIFHEITTKFTMLSTSYMIHLRPPLLLKNTLPIDLRISVAGCSVSTKNEDQSDTDLMQKNEDHIIKGEDYLDYGEKLVKPGEMLHLPTIKTTVKTGEEQYIVARLVQYLEKDWSCTTEIPPNPPQLAVWTFCSYDSIDKMTLELGVRFENKNGSLLVTVYCPFWMVNKTGLMLSYRSSDETINVLYHPPEYEGPILFSFREKVFFGKKKASVRIDAGDWSEKFSLDVAGSSGLIECKANNTTYELGVHIALTQNSLTKQITFMPFYILINNARYDIEVQEDSRPGDPWIKIESDQCVPFWPKSETSKMLRVKSTDARHVTPPFKYNDVQCTLLKLNNKHGGIMVDVHVTEGGIYITFASYYAGDAPALIINNTNSIMTFWEKGNINPRNLQPKERMFYTWHDPAGARIVLWHNGKDTIENDLRRDGVDQFSINENNPNKVYWVSFLDGMQRVLLFTWESNLANQVQSAARLDHVSQDITVSIKGIGLSLVNNIKHCDVLYIGIASSGVIWEESKKARFKQMKILETQMLEDRYQEYKRDIVVGVTLGKEYTIDNGKAIVDFKNMNLSRANNVRDIRRNFYPGLWLKMKTSPHQTQLHCKINRVQIDNQIIDCVFPVILAPVPPPKSVAATTELKPFIECSVVQRIIPHSTVKQFKYCRVLIQEFHIKVDLGFINALFEVVSMEISEEESARLFAEELKKQKQPLSDLVQSHSQQEQKNFYDNLHLGPLKIHISFSMAGSESKDMPGVLSTILQGVGVTLTDVNDVVFRLAFFEREYLFLTQRQLVSECVSHYAGQAVKQLYVLVLGLDVIGNPYGLVVGITKGVEDLFYEPFQGAIQGPGEFAEGLVLGVRSLFGHTVGGAAGAVSKITGAMGKGLAALTFDKDYQKKRRDLINKKPANLQEGIARSGKGLVMGVVDGVTGVFTKPISGAKADGVGGFFKGLGKGAVGLVTRPTAGVIDFASGSFDAVKRATEMTDDVVRLRPPRFLHADGIVRPYSSRDAKGNKMLKDIDKGKYATTDTFNYYEAIVEHHSAIILSDHRILYCIRNDLFGGWQVDWTHRWEEISLVHSSNRGVEIVLGGKDGKKMGFFGSSEPQKKIIMIIDKFKRDRLAVAMDRLRRGQVH